MKRAYFLGAIIIILSVSILFYIANIQCFYLKFISLPKEFKRYLDEDSNEIVFLFGNNLCATCPSGHYLLSIGSSNRAIYIVPNSFNQNDIENLRYAFDIRGKIIIGGIQREDFFKRISRCKAGNDKLFNYHFIIKDRSKIEKIIIF